MKVCSRDMISSPLPFIHSCLLCLWRQLLYLYHMESHRYEPITAHIPWPVDDVEVSPSGRFAAVVTNEDGISKLRLMEMDSLELQEVDLPMGVVVRCVCVSLFWCLSFLSFSCLPCPVFRVFSSVPIILVSCSVFAQHAVASLWRAS